MKSVVEVYLVAKACRVLATFCQKHGVSLNTEILAHFAIAWREGGSFEWTPCEKAFRRINAVAPQHVQDSTAIAIVFGYEGIDRKLTDELNKAIFKATDDRC